MMYKDHHSHHSQEGGSSSNRRRRRLGPAMADPAGGGMLDFDTSVWLYCSALALAVPVMVPALQFGFVYRLWAEYDHKVDREHCFCNCWDTAFKGQGSGSGSGSGSLLCYSSFPCKNHTKPEYVCTIVCVCVCVCTE